MAVSLRITPEITDNFFNYQLDRWPQAVSNYDILDEAYEHAEELLFAHRFWTVNKLILNYRKASASADIVAASEGKRQCFLCADARPDEQLTLDWGDYKILVNPYPLGLPHFTIIYKDHIPQRISGHIRDMARLTRVFDECCVFYNGPLCGASAPDHFHFQAFDIYNFENVERALKYGKEICRFGKSSIIIPPKNMYAAPLIILSVAKDSELEVLFDKVIRALPPADPEPMMNIVAAKMKSRTVFAIFPRRKHRPDCYGTGEGEFLVSPASAEMLGLFPCVGQKEFEALDEELIQKIYDDVCVTPETFQDIINRIIP